MSETITEVGDATRRGALGAAASSEACSEQAPSPSRCAIKALAACAWRTTELVANRRVHQPADNLGRRVSFADGSTATVYRETVIDGPEPMSPSVLVVCFRLRHVHSPWAHALFRAESQLNTVLFAGFPGLVSKLWLAHDENDLYRGFYQWDDPNLAVSYVRSLWWVLSLVSEPGSIHYAVLPGLDRDAVLAGPGLIDNKLSTTRGGWWRPVESETASAKIRPLVDWTGSPRAESNR